VSFNREHSAVLEDPQLMLNDFDGTQALTSETATGIPTVNDGYAAAIDELFGSEAADKFLKDGHGHSTPAEIVATLMDLDPNHEEVKQSVLFVVRKKLEILTAAIGRPLPDGTTWPRQSEGFAETWMGVHNAQVEGFPIGTAVVSAGHTEFEQKVFDMWGLPQPDMYLTDDIVNALALALPWEEQVKPSPMLVELAQTLHAYKLKRKVEAFKHSKALPSLIRTIHVGDADKDKQLAENAGIAYVIIDQDRQRESWQKVAGFLGISSFVVRNA
jgi:hypothetical protein